MAAKIVSLVHGELPIVLEEKENAPYNQGGPNTGISLGLKTEDIYETVYFLKGKEVQFIVGEPTDYPPGKYIRDPFGNILEYLQFDNE